MWFLRSYNKNRAVARLPLMMWWLNLLYHAKFTKTTYSITAFVSFSSSNITSFATLVNVSDPTVAIYAIRTIISDSISVW